MREGENPKILLPCPNRVQKPQAFPQARHPPHLPFTSHPGPPPTQLCVEKAVSTLAETSAQGNSNEEETVRETQRGRAGRGEDNSDKIEEKNEMGECSLEGQKRRGGGWFRRGC